MLSVADASLRALGSEVDVSLRGPLSEECASLRAPLPEVDASLPSREEESLSDDSLLVVDASFDSTSSARKTSPLASWETPHGVGEEFPSPVSAVESSGRKKNCPPLPALARPSTAAFLPAPEPPAAGMTALPLQASPATSRLEYPPPYLPA